MVKSKSFYFLIGMILLSLALGIFVSYLLIFANSLFISEIGTSKLPMAHVASGIGGLVITLLFSYSEKKWGFAKASTFFSLFFALLVFLTWYAYVNDFYLNYVIFFAYTMYWFSANFTSLIFWKIPSNIFNLEENKKYSGIISSGEGISAVICFFSVPLLLNIDLFTRDKFLLISFFGILSFSGITFLLSKGIVAKEPADKISDTKDSSPSDQKQIIKEPYFKFIFLSVLLAVIIQFVVDFSLMEVSAKQVDPLQLAQHFALVIGGNRLFELVIKSFFSKYLIKEYGVFISLTSLIFALGIITIIGISSYFTGYMELIIIVASLSKIFERSMYRSLYAPTINLLYQAYPKGKRSLTQNYADGFGKTIGQIIAAILIFSVSAVESFEYKVLYLLVLALVILIIWLFVSKKLMQYYRIELLNILNTLNVSTAFQVENGISPIKEESALTNGKRLDFNPVERAMNTIVKFLSLEKIGTSQLSDPSSSEFLKNPSEDEEKAFVTETKTFIATVASCSGPQLQKILNQVFTLKQNVQNSSRLLELIELFLQTSIMQKDPNFNFYTSQKNLKASDFLYTSVIQHLIKKQGQELENQEYYYLLEERIQKYTYLLICHKDLEKSYPVLDRLLLAETKAAKNDILYCLSFKRDKNTLDQIVTMINQGDKTQELISLELLELILNEQEKKWVLPIFKEANSDKILIKLQSDFPQVVLGNEKRLLSILSSYQLDLPDLIKSQALLGLQRDFPSEANQAVFNSITNSNPKLKQLTSGEMNYGSQGKLSSQETRVEPLANPVLGKDLPINKSFDEIPTLHYFYWINNLETKEMDTVAEKSLHATYKTLFSEVFPMEKLN